MRGFEVTKYKRPNWPPPVAFHYDEEWCANLDKAVIPTTAQSVKASNYVVSNW